MKNQGNTSGLFLSTLESLPVLLDKHEELSSSFGGMSNFPNLSEKIPFWAEHVNTSFKPFPGHRKPGFHIQLAHI